MLNPPPPPPCCLVVFSFFETKSPIASKEECQMMLAGPPVPAAGSLLALQLQLQDPGVIAGTCISLLCLSSGGACISLFAKCFSTKIVWGA